MKIPNDSQSKSHCEEEETELSVAGLSDPTAIKKGRYRRKVAIIDGYMARRGGAGSDVLRFLMRWQVGAMTPWPLLAYHCAACGQRRWFRFPSQGHVGRMIKHDTDKYTQTSCVTRSGLVSGSPRIFLCLVRGRTVSRWNARGAKGWSVCDTQLDLLGFVTCIGLEVLTILQGFAVENNFFSPSIYTMALVL